MMKIGFRVLAGITLKHQQNSPDFELASHLQPIGAGALHRVRKNDTGVAANRTCSHTCVTFKSSDVFHGLQQPCFLWQRPVLPKTYTAASPEI